MEVEKKKTIPKRDFVIFRKEFLRWVAIFGLQEYRTTFVHEDLPNHYANMDVDESGKWAIVRLGTELVGNDDIRGWVDAKTHAKHEAVHLLLNRLHCLAKNRYATVREINDEAERIVCILEKALR